MEETFPSWIIPSALGLLALGFLIYILVRGLFTVTQGTAVVVTRFGKFHKVSFPGLNFKNPFLDGIYDEVSLQNASIELKFSAVTRDQANVHFAAMLLYAAHDQSEETIHTIAFKFQSAEDRALAMRKTIEGTIRSFVATKQQAEILALRREIIQYVKQELDVHLQEWGFQLIDVQMNDITFDNEITASMARVVASANERMAAENEGAALLIQKTKEAEAEGQYIMIQAKAEKEAAKLRGEGVAEYRKAVAVGISESAQELKDHGVDTVTPILFSMWTEAVKNFAEVGKGNVIFLDGSVDGMQRVLAFMKTQTTPHDLTSAINKTINR